MRLHLLLLTLALALMSSVLHELLPFQLAWVNDPARFKIWLASRQVGKSQAAVTEAVRDCVTHARTTWIILSTTKQQALEAFRKAEEFAECFKPPFLHYADFSMKPFRRKIGEMTWANGSRLLTLAANPQSVRGYSANLILDEFAFHRDSKSIWRSIYPSISNPLKATYKLRIVSTANGRNNNHFFELWKSKQPKYRKYLLNIYQALEQGLARGQDKQLFIDDLKAGLSDQLGWQQEYECQFTDGQETLLSYEQIVAAETPDASTDNTDFLKRKTGLFFCGIDYGRSNDPTVCWMLEQVGDVLWTREVLVLHKIDTVTQNTILRKRIVRCTRAAIDSTGPGIGFADYIAQYAGDKVQNCTFTVGFKRLLFPRLARRFQPPVSVRIPIDDQIREDLHNISQTINNGEFYYTARRSKEGHSDRAIALALAIHASAEYSPAQEPGQIIPVKGPRRPRNLVG